MGVVSGEVGEVEEESGGEVELVLTAVRLTVEQYAKLERLAIETASGPRRGGSASKRSWRSMLRRIAEGEVEVRETEWARIEREEWERGVALRKATRAAGVGQRRGPKGKGTP